MFFEKYKGLYFPVLIVTVVVLLFVYIAVQFDMDKITERVNTLDREIRDTDTEIKVLRTEISHLTSVSRIREIADKYLKNYQHIKNNDFVSGIDIPLNPNLE